VKRTCIVVGAVLGMASGCGAAFISGLIQQGKDPGDFRRGLLDGIFTVPIGLVFGLLLGIFVSEYLETRD
jgi:hypothetical protein